MWIILIILVALAIIEALVFSFVKDEDSHREIAVYGGSFDPLHIGHKAILEEISNKYDWVYLMVTPQNPLKNHKSSDIDERIRQAHDALLKNEVLNVTVSSIEKEMVPPYYTIRTLDFLKKRTPKNNITLIIGADNLSNIKKWNSYERILLEYGVEVFPRGDFNVDRLYELKDELLKENSQYKIKINNTLIPNISSTEIRDALERGNEEIKKLLM